MLSTPFAQVRFAILLGVLVGMIAWLLLASVERPSFFLLAKWIFREDNSKVLYTLPGYYCIHRTILLVLSGVGGGAGIAISNTKGWQGWFFLAGLLIVIAVIASFFPQ